MHQKDKSGSRIVRLKISLIASLSAVLTLSSAIGQQEPGKDITAVPAMGLTSPLSSQIPDRTKAGAITSLALSCLPAVHAVDAAQWEVFETSYESAKAYSNAFTEVEVGVVFTQGEKQWKVPAFWAGDRKWTVRFAPP